MQIKSAENKKSYLNLFDILDSTRKETNLSKVLAYLAGVDPKVIRALCKLLDIKLEQKSSSWFKSLDIKIEKSYKAAELNDSDKGGRTDIEIEFTDKETRYFLIIECKVGSGKATREQFELYKPIYDKKEDDKYKKFFVFLSHQSGINLHGGDNNLNIIDITWRELINELADQNPNAGEELDEFLKYYERSYGMANQKEILIQDVGLDSEIRRYQNGVYRRGKVNGSPLYFAPYFTRGNLANLDEGIPSLSKILGIITIKNIKWELVQDTCEKLIENSFSNEEFPLKKKELLPKWQAALEIENDIQGEDATYYFLDSPVKLQANLLKDKSGKKGRGKGWIAAMIPKNRCVTFADFLRNYSIKG